MPVMRCKYHRKWIVINVSVLRSVKDHIMIGGPNAIAGWGLLVLLVFSGGFWRGFLYVDLALFLPVLLAAVLTGNGIYALNAYYDSFADKINKPKRPIPSGRISPEHAKRYSWTLMALGMVTAVAISVYFDRYIMASLWSLFTLLGLAYSTPPLKLKSRHIFGNLTFGLFAGLSFLIGNVYSGQSFTLDFLQQIFWTTIMVAGIITMKDFYDVEGDKAEGDVTLPVKVGKKWAAVIGMVLMASPAIYEVLTWSRSYPLTLTVFIDRNFWELVYIISFGVYIGLDYAVQKSLLSDPYARVQYYFVILLVAWQFLSGALRLWNIPELVERSGILVLYIGAASVAVYLSWKKKRDVLKFL